MIASELNTSAKRGGYSIPILYMANKDNVLINRFGTNGLFTKYSNRIENVYNKKNEPLFSKLEMITTDGEIITIEGKDIIDNAIINDEGTAGSPYAHDRAHISVDAECL